MSVGCQYTLSAQSPIADAEGQYQRVQFTYAASAEAVPQRFSADVLIFSPGAVRAELLDQPNLEVHKTVPEAAVNQGAIAAVNGGYYGEAFEPIGLYILGGQQQQPLSTESSLLTGVLSIDQTGQISLSTRFEFSPQGVVSAFQSGPFVIDPGSELGIYSDDGQLRQRTAIARSDASETVVLTTSPVSLYALAQCLHTQPAAFGVDRVERALNLDGGVSTGMYAALPSATLSKPEEVSVRSILLFYDPKSARF